jgi:hypothetical protein
MESQLLMRIDEKIFLEIDCLCLAYSKPIEPLSQFKRRFSCFCAIVSVEARDAQTPKTTDICRRFHGSHVGSISDMWYETLLTSSAFFNHSVKAVQRSL